MKLLTIILTLSFPKKCIILWLIFFAGTFSLHQEVFSNVSFFLSRPNSCRPGRNYSLILVEYSLLKCQEKSLTATFRVFLQGSFLTFNILVEKIPLKYETQMSENIDSISVIVFCIYKVSHTFRQGWN